MPHISITMKPGRSLEIKKAIAEKMQQALAEQLGLEINRVSVSIEDIPGEMWEESLSQIKKETIIIPPAGM